MAITDAEASVTEPNLLLAVMVSHVVTLSPSGTWPRVGVNINASTTLLISLMTPKSPLTGVAETVNVPPLIVPPSASENVPSAGLDIVTVSVSGEPTWVSVRTTSAAAIGLWSDVICPGVAPRICRPPLTVLLDTMSIVDVAVTVSDAPSLIDIVIVVVANCPLGSAGSEVT